MPRLHRATRAAFPLVATVDAALAGARSPAAHRARRVTKPLLLPLLALGSTAPPGPVRNRVALGQACGWVGDVVLLDDGDAALLAGACAFGVGHLAYAGAFRRAGAGGTPRVATAAGAVAAAALGALATSPLAGNRQHPGQATALAAYSFLLGRTPTGAAALPSQARGRRLALAGGVLFALSDTLLFTRKVLLRNPHPALESAVMATYCTAQALIARFAEAESG